MSLLASSNLVSWNAADVTLVSFTNVLGRDVLSVRPLPGPPAQPRLLLKLSASPAY